MGSTLLATLSDLRCVCAIALLLSVATTFALLLASSTALLTFGLIGSIEGIPLSEYPLLWGSVGMVATYALRAVVILVLEMVECA